MFGKGQRQRGGTAETDVGKVKEHAENCGLHRARRLRAPQRQVLYKDQKVERRTSDKRQKNKSALMENFSILLADNERIRDANRQITDKHLYWSAGEI